jgi:predicted dehydrogenase
MILFRALANAGAFILFLEPMYQFALIGCGAVSGMHTAQLRKHGKLQAVCDHDKLKADELAASTGSRAYYHIDDMLEGENELDLICVCTPNGFHAEHCIKSLQAGLHVICESPLCLTTAAAWQMIETEKFCRKKLMVVHASRMHSTNELLSSLRELLPVNQPGFELQVSVASGTASAGWRHSMFPGGGLLYAYFVNDIDLLLTIFGEIETVQKFSENGLQRRKDEVERSGGVQLKMKDGASGIIRWNGEPEGDLFEVRSAASPFMIQDLQQRRRPGETDYAELYRYFMDTLEKDAPSNLYEGMQTVQAIEKIYQAYSPKPSPSH